MLLLILGYAVAFVAGVMFAIFRINVAFEEEFKRRQK